MKNNITICMGSSCFARGNRENLEQVETYLLANNIAAEISFVGCRCRNECGRGPNIEFNGILHHQVDAGTLLDLLEYYFANVEVNA